MTTAAQMLRASWSEPYQMPEFLKAASVLLRLAQPFFYELEFTEASPASNIAALGNWKVLRRASRLILERGAMHLMPTEIYQLREALAHCPAGGDVAYLMAQTWDERG